MTRERKKKEKTWTHLTCITWSKTIKKKWSINNENTESKNKAWQLKNHTPMYKYIESKFTYTHTRAYTPANIHTDTTLREDSQCLYIQIRAQNRSHDRRVLFEGLRPRPLLAGPWRDPHDRPTQRTTASEYANVSVRVRKSGRRGNKRKSKSKRKKLSKLVSKQVSK